MATSVQVLCPNGRRQNVKVTPNTKLLQVLEEVCMKQGFLPFDDYDLIHGRKTVDLTLAFRFSNLSNNAKLEIVKSASPRSQAQGDVTIALQLANGERLQHTFHSSVTLWKILQHWEQQDEKYKEQLTCVDGSQCPPVHPVCIYMREEVVGVEALQYVTLKKLALTSGKAIIRLVHRPVDDGTLAEVVGKIEQEKAKDAQLAQKALTVEQTVPSSQAPPAVAQQSAPVDTSLSLSTNITSQATEIEEMEVDRQTGRKSPQKKQGRTRKGSSPEPMDTEDTRPLSPKAQKKPAEAKAEKGSAGNASSVDSSSAGSGVGASGSVSGIEQLRSMNIPGVEIITPQDFHNLTPEEQQMARRLMQQFMPATLAQQGPPTPIKPLPAPQTFTDFKFPEATKGKDLYHNELSEVKTDDFKPCERETVVFNINEADTSKAIGEEPTEDFFQLTESDVRSLYKERQKQASLERPLMTESMRQLELEEKHQHYTNVVIRVQFPDGLVLQGCFRPRETVFALHKFVKDHLEDKSQNFKLYTTPPKHVLTDMSRTLVQANLAPASVVYYISDKEEEHNLSSSTRAEVSSKRRAEELSVRKLAKKQMEMGMIGGCQVAISSGPSCSGSSAGGYTQAARDTHLSSSRPAQKTPASTAGEAKMPKWLKIGKK